jgi:hypothetical protein
MKPQRGLVSVKDFARLRHQDPFTTYRQLWTKKVKGVRRGRRWLIPISQLLRPKKGGE